jgi:threonine dehydratase
VHEWLLIHATEFLSVCLQVIAGQGTVAHEILKARNGRLSILTVVSHLHNACRMLLAPAVSCSTIANVAQLPSATLSHTLASHLQHVHY